jgi:2-polyprenyl-3-methyl-5-hydroxy-6-metoxy-1,4-benzoquinol methylase
MEFVNQCPSCDGDLFSPYRTCLDHTVSHETFQLMRCETCKLVLTSPRPLSKDLGRYYVSDDYISHTPKSKKFFDKVYQLSRHFTLKWKLNLVRENALTSNGIQTLLDYGCGTGEFLYKCKNEGIKIKGVEPSDIARTYASELIGQPVYGSIEESTETFDAITLWHVLEHVPDLNNIILLLKEKLNKNGTMFIAVPNHLSKDAQVYKSLWAAYDVPRHLWHFNKQSMEHLLNKLSLKLEKTIPMQLDSYYVSMLSEKHKAGKSTFAGLIKGFLNGAKSNYAARNTGEYSSLIYVVRK